MGIVFRWSDRAESRTDIHQGGNNRAHAGDIIHVIHQHHETSTAEHHKNINNKIAYRQVDNDPVDRPAIQPHRDHRHGLKKYSFYGCHHELPDDDVMDHFNAAGGGSGAGTDKARYIEKHLCGLGPFLIIGGGEAGGGQERHDLESGVSNGIHRAVVRAFLP